MAGASLLSPYLPRLHDLLASGGRRILGLVGPPGAGKSTIADAILEALPGQAVVVPMDGFHLANIELARLGRADRKGAHDTFDAAGFVALLRRLREPVPGETVYAPLFRREIEEPIANAIPVPADIPLVITEGNYLLLQEGAWAGVRPLLDEAWFLDIDADLRHRRLVDRHVRFGRRSDEAEAWVAGTDEPNARLIETTRGLATLVVR